MERRKQILVADNDEDLLMRLQVLFEDRGYATTIAWGGRELLKELQSKRFDLIVVGDYLPDISSGELWKNLRRLAGGASVALLQTEEPVKEMAGQYSGAGGRCVLVKSSPYKIVETVCGCLSKGEDHLLHWVNPAGAGAMEAQAPARAGQGMAR